MVDKPRRTWSSSASALALTLTFSAFYGLFAFVTVPAFFPDNADLARTNFLPRALPPPSQAPAYIWCSVWERFDTLWYTHIAGHGYDLPAAVVFYPLFPVLIRALTLCGLDPVASAVLLTRVATFFLLWGLLELFRLDLDAKQSNRAVALALVWPGSFILFAAYPDSLVGAFLVWSVLLARRDRWWEAGGLGLLAGITKAVGGLVLVPLLVIAARDWRRRLGPLLLCAAGAAAYPTGLMLAGLPLPGSIYPRYWRVIPSWPWETLWTAVRALSGENGWLVGANLAGLILFAVALWRRRLRLEYSAFAAACFLLFLTKKTDPALQSSLRYLTAVFPAFASMTLWLPREALFGALFCLAVLVNLVGLFGFWNWTLLV